MILIRKKLISSLILIFVLSRVIVDLTWELDKPAYVVVAYLALCLFLSINLIVSSNSGAAKAAICALFCVYPAILLFSQLYSSVGFFEHVRYATQVLMPCVFLVAATFSPGVATSSSDTYVKHWGGVVLFVLVISAYVEYAAADSGQGFFDYYQNSPSHIRAQTLLKATLPMLNSGVIWLAMPFIFLFVLNVRSAFLSYLLSVICSKIKVMKNKKTVGKLILVGIPVFFIFVFSLDWGDLYTRLFFKGQDISDLGAGVALTSGRNIIYKWYVMYILENFGVLEWLFGVGPIWLQENGPVLSAHNDILNLLVSFGLFGLIGTLLCYWYFYINLPSKTARIIFFLSFGILFMTNGVTFHQSNVLFVLLYTSFLARPEINSEASQKHKFFSKRV